MLNILLRALVAFAALFASVDALAQDAARDYPLF